MPRSLFVRQCTDWVKRTHGSHWEVEDPLSSINVEEYREVRIEREPGMKGEILKRSITKE